MAIVNMNAASYRQSVLEGDKPVLVEYWAPWCVYCRRIVPAMEKISVQYADSVLVAQINIDDEPQLAAKEQIEVIPTLVLYHKGQAINSIVAPESKAAIEQFIQDSLNK